MALLVSDKQAEEIREWMEIVEKYNQTVHGQRSPYAVEKIRNDENGYTLLVLKKK